MYRAWGKRLFDFIGSLGLLILLSPIILIVSILNVIYHGSPVFFRQKRPGKNDRIFEMVKFRSMKDAKGPDGSPLPDDQRMTRFGSLLRASSLDELPELWNVLKGEMSLVGPRPLLVQYLPLYSEEQRQRHQVRPGVTGWAQVNGRNAISWEQKFAYDVWYVENLSFGLDIKILFMTVGKVFKRSGITQEGQATMTAFQGNDADGKPL